jgi:tRNA(Ile)-lysidine synthase
MSSSSKALLAQATFPAPGTSVELAVSGGPDSLGLLLLALEHGLDVRVAHVDHHARATSSAEAEHLRTICQALKVPIVVHDITVELGPNFEERARLERRRVLAQDCLTGHTMDDVAETIILNMLRGAGTTGLSPMINDPTKPLAGVRRAELHAFVGESGFEPIIDPSNADLTYRRNEVRHKLLPHMNEVAQRDVVPILYRQATVLFEEREWLDLLFPEDTALSLEQADCRELRDWPRARLRRWLRLQLATGDSFNKVPPTLDEVDRAIEVIQGEFTATELSGGRRLARKDQALYWG